MVERLGSPNPLEIDSEHTLAPTLHMGDAMAAAYSQGVKKGKEETANRNEEALRVLSGESFKLGDLNPLTHKLDFSRTESVEAVGLTVLNKIETTGGLIPTFLGSAMVYDPDKDVSLPRFIARFELPKPTKTQLEMIEALVRQTYGSSARTTTDSDGKEISSQEMPPIQPSREASSKKGWYMGPNLEQTSALHEGLFMFLDQDRLTKDTFLTASEDEGSYVFEIREAGQYQTDLSTFATQVAGILGKAELLDRGQILYETYNDLIRLNLKDSAPAYGLEGAIGTIKRELLTLLASPDIAAGVGEKPQSVLLFGYMGTGKTLVVEKLLQMDTGVFILPLDPFELQKELMKAKEEQTLLPRIAEISTITGRQVVLHVDDVDILVNKNGDTHSTLLNLMAGVEDRGFYIIASTNHPEDISPSLMQPQRFSVPIHCGLQDQSGRYEILKNHVDFTSKNLGIPLFESDKLRDIILHAVAARTEFFTPRYLANIVTIAKTHLIERVAKEKETRIGLEEADLEGHIFEASDWDEALDEVGAKCNTKEVEARNKELENFVNQLGSKGSDFLRAVPVQNRSIADDIQRRLVAAEVELKQN